MILRLRATVYGFNSSTQKENSDYLYWVIWYELDFQRVLNLLIRIEYDVCRPNLEQESKNTQICVFIIS
jgi:hypothetical protein